jgi:4-hydroxy-tetrahydrodipicolinate reductase
MRMRAGVAGLGRMGRLVAEEILDAGAVPVGVADPRPSFAELAAGSEVVIEFSHPSVVQAHAAVIAASHAAWVLGTTGLSGPDEDAVRAAAAAAPVVFAANFSPGVTLALELASRMAAALPASAYDAEIVEMHHRQKVDAPSGTALALGRAVARGRGIDFADAAESRQDGRTGARRDGAIGFAALRGGQVVGEHTLLFAGADEHLALTHRAFDRRVFARGAVRAALWAAGRQPGLYDMRDVLGLR